MLTREEINFLIQDNKAMKIKITRLMDIIERQKIRFEDAEEDKKELKNKIKKLERTIYELAQSSFPYDFSNENMQYKKFEDIIEFLYRKISELEENNMKIEKKEEDYKKQIKELEEKLNKVTEELNKIKTEIKEGKYIVNTNTENDNEIDYETETLPVPKKITPDEVLENYKKGNKELLEKFIKTISDIDFKIIQTIGEGNTLFSNISKSLNSSNKNTKQIIENNLLPKQILRVEIFNSGGKGRPAKHFFLTELGEIVYKEKFNKEVNKTKKQELSTHGSAHHGGLIANVGEILSNNGYEIEYEKPFILIDSTRVIPDIYAYDSRINEVMLIECERVKNPPSLKEKFEKYYKLFSEKQGGTNIVHFIVPDNNALNTLHQELFKWIKDNKHGLKMLPPNQFSKAKIVFKTLTFEEFKQQKYPRAFYYGQK